jgi:hypothetical protein
VLGSDHLNSRRLGAFLEETLAAMTTALHQPAPQPKQRVSDFHAVCEPDLSNFGRGGSPPASKTQVAGPDPVRRGYTAETFTRAESFVHQLQCDLERRAAAHAATAAIIGEHAA